MSAAALVAAADMVYNPTNPPMGSIWEILYLSIAVVTAYQAIFLLRRGGPGPRPYAMLLFADAALASVAYFGTKSTDGTSRVAELLGAVAIFAFVGLVVVPPILRELTRRALASERLELALFLTR